MLILPDHSAFAPAQIDWADPINIDCRIIADFNPRNPTETINPFHARRPGSNTSIVPGGFVEAGPSGMAYDFDGTNDYVTWSKYALSEVTDQLTLSTWINVDTTQQATFTFGSTSGTNWDWGLFLTGGGVDNFRFFCRNASASTAFATSASTFALGVWYHVVCIYNGAAVVIYVDGVRGTDGTLSGDLDDRDYAPGLGFGWNSNPCDAKIGTSRLWSRALSFEEVQRLSYEPRAGLQPTEGFPIMAATAAGGTIPRYAIDSLSGGFSGHPVASLNGGVAA